jgi:fucose permease
MLRWDCSHRERSRLAEDNVTNTTRRNRAKLAIRRDSATWACYLLLGVFTFVLNIQGNIIPFLRVELDLDYRAVSLHPVAIAAGMVITGLIAERIVRRLGRLGAILLGIAGAACGSVLLCTAQSAWGSIAGCALIGVPGALLTATIPAALARMHGPGREVAYAEANVLCYGWALLAPMAVGAATALGLGWRVALLGGAGAGVLLAVWARRVCLPEADAKPVPGTGERLPPAFWAYATALGFGVAVEYSALLWSPEFLERVAGMERAGAAAGSSAFAAAMLTGRLAGSLLVRHLPPGLLYPGALVLTLPGFALYWASGAPVPALIGLFVLGLGVSVLYPLALGFAVGTAGTQGDAASARASLAAGIALLFAPMLLGALADDLGLANAMLIVPVLVAAAMVAFCVGCVLEARPGRRVAGQVCGAE